jgi:hypothetical protein
VTPDEVVNSGTEDAPVYSSIRQGRFEATCMLQIMATESQTRDRLWDSAVNVLLMGRKKGPQRNFYSTIETHDLVGLTVMEGSVRNVGDTISMGTPWDPELLTYEAAIEFDIVGTFYADEYNESLVPLKVAIIYDYIADVEPPPLEDDLTLFSAKIVNQVPKNTDPVINIQLDTAVPPHLIDGEHITTIGLDDFQILKSPWLAKMNNEDFFVLMVGDTDPSLIRVHRAQVGTLPDTHVVGSDFKHSGTNWKTWMA